MPKAFSNRHGEMAAIFLTTGLFVIFLVFLTGESILLNRRIRKIQLRITVSGTRGKSATVRTLATIFRLHGIRTFAKTTGSEATLILPDGTIEPLHRRGSATILEQLKTMAKAARLDAACTIIEIMSIHPENHRTETARILKPDYTLLTNFRPDHTENHRGSVEEMVRIYGHDIQLNSKVFVSEIEINDLIIKEINNKHSTLIRIPAGLCRELDLPERIFDSHHPANLDLAISAARHFGIPDATIARGITETSLDIGKPDIYLLPSGHFRIWFVNNFAANDPLSSMEQIHAIRRRLSDGSETRPATAGFLSLRHDRGERSRQWLDFLRGLENPVFSRLFVTGANAPVFERQLKHCQRMNTRDPRKIIEILTREIQEDTLIFGLVNIHGTGFRLLKYLEPYKTAI
jgi:poly-gamma-glutamate synthase PgsB/CapB